jgi:hypothetical protein
VLVSNKLTGCFRNFGGTTLSELEGILCKSAQANLRHIQVLLLLISTMLCVCVCVCVCVCEALRDARGNADLQVQRDVLCTCK